MAVIHEPDNSNELICSMNKLLDELRTFMRTYVLTPDVPMPEHSIIWIESMSGDGPAKTILDAIKCEPSLWLGALPEDVCVVPRSTLKHLGVPDDAIDYISALGRREIDINASKYKYELENAQETNINLNHPVNLMGALVDRPCPPSGPLVPGKSRRLPRQRND